jgi:hypothetical protein
MLAKEQWYEPEEADPETSSRHGLTLPDTTTMLMLIVVLAFVFGLLIGHALPQQFELNP